MNESEKLCAAIDVIRDHEDEIITILERLECTGESSAAERVFDVQNAMESLAEELESCGNP